LISAEEDGSCVLVGLAEAAQRVPESEDESMAQLTEQDIGFQNVAFDDRGERIVGVLIGINRDGDYVVGNPYFNHTWHVPPALATPTDDAMTVRGGEE
jgi:hypothetical protein